MIPLALLLAACGGPCKGEGGCVVGEDLDAGLLSVRVAAPGDVWIVGASPDDGTGPVALHRDGESFTRLDTTAWAGAELWWAWVDGSEGVFVGNEGLILELDRASGSIEVAPGPTDDITFFGVWGASGDDLWAVGQSGGGSGPPALWRRQGGTWSAFDAGLAPEDGSVYFKVHGAAADDAWIVGTLGKALHWDGTAWTDVATDAEVPTDTSPLLTVDVGGERPIAVGGAGNGLILEYDGTDWRDASPDFQPGFNGVCAGAGTAWAVGQAGARAQRVDGAWVSDNDADIERTTSLDWHGCAIEEDGSLWTVGGRIGSRPLIQGVIGYTGTDEPENVGL